jgi:hypothetical protein
MLGLRRLPLHIGAAEPGLVISPPFPISPFLPRIWAPWAGIALSGPSWFKREDLDIRGVIIAVPASVAEYIREKQQ